MDKVLVIGTVLYYLLVVSQSASIRKYDFNSHVKVLTFDLF